MRVNKDWIKSLEVAGMYETIQRKKGTLNE